MVERVIERVLQSKVDKVVVASPHDLEIKLNVPVFIGDEQDVLKRYYDCAKFFDGEIIVRITSDCPLIDPKIIDYAIDYLIDNQLEYVIFAPVDGLDVEVFTFEMLREAHWCAITDNDKEHVTPYMRRKTKISVDDTESLEKVRKIWNGKIR